MEKLDRIEETYVSVFEAIEEYSKYRINDNRLSVIINQGLNVFSQFPETDYCALFLLNDETFEFEHSATIPDSSEGSALGVFPNLVENGLIGGALNTGTVSYNPDRSAKEYDHYLIAPLLSSSSALGLVLLKLKMSAKDLPSSFFALCNIQSSLYASSLENIFLQNKNAQAKELLEQKVAYRTMNLVENQKQLSDKFRHLQSNISMSIPHEVRTPLNQILGFSKYLLDFIDSEEYPDAIEMLNDIRESAERLRRLFENYLFYANLSIISVDINEITNLQKKTTYSAQSIIFDKASNMALEFERDNDLEMDLIDGQICIGEEFFTKIIEELLDNALKCSAKGEKIKIKSLVDNDYYYLSVSDGGRGMSDEQIKNIEPYMQFDRKIYEQQGSGLGLAIVRRIIDLHNGGFEIISSPDKFTTVNLKLPVSEEIDLL